MTLERPMFPPRADESQVIQFSDFAKPKADERIPVSFRRRDRALPEPLTDTCRNQRLRLSRRDAWWAAMRLTNYWRARLDWHSALGTAQNYGVADSHKFPSAENESRLELVALWRDALVKQMLTPAPDVAAINWKRVQMKAQNYLYTDVKPERLQHAIDADVEWLEAHPSRKSIAASRQAKKVDGEQRGTP